MRVITSRNVHRALPLALDALAGNGINSDSRNGPVRRFDGPVTTLYERPTERVMFWPERNCNPFFHLAESLWMLAGRNDVDYVARYVARMRTFSDDGATLHGAYGHRWRVHFQRDQLLDVIEALRKNPNDRRVVLSMWDAHVDLGREGRDFPCNLQAIFSVNAAGALDMMVTNRSNDIIWGAYGANAVHFSYLQEYIASFIGREVGRYWQVSNNFHAYLDTLEQVQSLADLGDIALAMGDRWLRWCPYTNDEVKPYPLVGLGWDRSAWDAELAMFLEEPEAVGFRHPFFRRVALPMHMAWRNWKEARSLHAAIEHAKAIGASDWRKAAVEWLQRAEARRRKAEDDGAQAAAASELG